MSASVWVDEIGRLVQLRLGHRLLLCLKEVPAGVSDGGSPEIEVPVPDSSEPP